MRGIGQVEFDQAFNTWYDPIRNFIYYKTGDMQTAEDIAQETFLKVWVKRSDVNNETIKHLLYTIANHLFLNRLSHEKVSFNFKNNYQQPVNTNSPEFDMEMNEFDAKLQKALADLDENKRTVFLMNRIDDFTYNEIAGQLGITVKAVEKRMEKALAFLRKRIDVNI
jgi:RNA polymerase sigma-70 factor (ECF subfamily)